LQIIVISFLRITGDNISVYENIDENVSVKGKITDIQLKPGQTVLTLSDIIVDTGPPVKSSDKLSVYLSENKHLKIGMIIQVKGSASSYNHATNPGEFDTASYYHNKGFAYMIFSDNILILNNNYNHFKQFLFNLSEKIKNTYYEYLPEDKASIVSGIVLGKRYLISEEDSTMYSRNGIMHLLAVSGMHVSTISVLIIWFMSRMPVSYVKARVIIIIFLIMYGCLTGFGVSCIRAVIMIVLSIFANLTGRPYDPLNAISFAGIVILLINPIYLFEASFLLSFSAVTAVTVVTPYIKEKTESLLALSNIIVLLITAPIILYFYNDLALYSVFINLIVIPIMSVLFLTAILLVLFCNLFSFAGVFFAGTVNYVLDFYEHICTFFDKYFYDIRITGHISHNAIYIYCIVLICMLTLLHYLKKKVVLRVVCLGMCIMCLLVLLHKSEDNNVHITMIDVGQGDGLCIETINDKCIMFDCGSSDESNLAKYTLEPFLRYKGIRHIDVWFVSHLDTDHISGIIEVLERNKLNFLTVGTLVLPETSEDRTDNPFERYEGKLINKIVYMSKGDIISCDELRFTCYNPSSKVVDVNDSSLVFGMNYKDFDMLFTGDISSEVERNLLGTIDRHFDVLKVAHHGSKNSTCDEFLERIKPKIALISAGKDNSYGHPAEETLKRLKDVESRVFTTQKYGALTLDIDSKIVIHAFLKGSSY